MSMVTKRIRSTIASSGTLAFMKLLIALLGTMLFCSPVPGLSKSPKTKTIQTPDGPVTAITAAVDPTHQEFAVASAAQRAELDALAFQATDFVKAYLPGVSTPTLSDLDMAFSIWQKTGDSRYTEHQVIEILGAYLGKKLADDFQMDWAIVTDQYGKDFAVRGRKYEVTAFPFSSVLKRIERQQHDFMVGIYYTVQDLSMNGTAKLR